MNTNFSVPLSNGFKRMKIALFQPFEISKWINIGLTAFLAGLTDCASGGSFGGNYKYKDFNWDDFFYFPETVQEWLASHLLWFSLIIVGVVLLVAITIVLIWLNSRGNFMFLYNVLNNRDEVGPFDNACVVKVFRFGSTQHGQSINLWPFCFCAKYSCWDRRSHGVDHDLLHRTFVYRHSFCRFSYLIANKLYFPRIQYRIFGLLWR